MATVEVARGTNSACGLLALLEEQDDSILAVALDQLVAVVDAFWPEIAERLDIIEKLAETRTFEKNTTAALIASKVYFHLTAFDEALRFLLAAGASFKLNEPSLYVSTMIAKCVDEYTKFKKAEYESRLERMCSSSALSRVPSANYVTADAALTENVLGADRRLEAIVEQIIDSSTSQGDERESLGVALEACRLDKVEAILAQSKNLLKSLMYCSTTAAGFVTLKRFRADVYQLLVQFYERFLKSSDVPQHHREAYTELMRCLYQIGDVQKAAALLRSLVDKGVDDAPTRATSASPGPDPPSNADVDSLIARQLAFDLVELEDQAFLQQLLDDPHLQIPESAETKKVAEVTGEDDKPKEINEPDEVPVPQTRKQSSSSDAKATDIEMSNVGKADEAAASATETIQRVQGCTEDKTLAAPLPGWAKSVKIIRRILSRDVSISMEIQFLNKSNQTDLTILERFKNQCDPRSSIIHFSIVAAHGLMQTGTTNDSFLRHNLSWLGKAACWAKFSATASLGTIHKGHIKESRGVLSAYLPGQGGSVYAEAGSLYALGLIHVNHFDSDTKSYLLDQLKNAQGNEILQHGCCLGLGLLSMGTEDAELREQLKSVLFLDSAVAGEAAALALGLVMLGTSNEEVVTELICQAKDTQHEKISRSCMLAIALIMYQKEDDANAIIDQLLDDPDATIRYGGATMVGLAFCATANSGAIQRLLSACASDVSDDVRRAAVVAIAFVLANRPAQVKEVMKLLSQSYNLQVRYASALALGIACSGTADSEVLEMLCDMTCDENYVRQAIYISMGLALMQTADVRVPSRVGRVRDILLSCATDKSEDVVARLGAIVGSGLLDAGGRNVTASMFSASGNLRRQGVVGFILFAQLWYWLPLTYTVALTFRPTAVIGLDKDLKMPKDFSLRFESSNEALFTYPAKVENQKPEAKRETYTAVLSATRKDKVDEKRRARVPPTKDGKSDGKDAKVLKRRSKVPPAKDGKSDGKSSLEAPDDTMGQDSTVGVDVSSIAATSGDAGESRGAPTEESSVISDHKMAATEDDTGTATSEGAVTGPLRTDSPEAYTVMSNPSRMLKLQESYVSEIPNARYSSVIPNRRSGFIMLIDSRPGEPAEFVATETEGDAEAVSTEFEPPVPEPFHWAG